jgi:hypothetical protein
MGGRIFFVTNSGNCVVTNSGNCGFWRPIGRLQGAGGGLCDTLREKRKPRRAATSRTPALHEKPRAQLRRANETRLERLRPRLFELPSSPSSASNSSSEWPAPSTTQVRGESEWRTGSCVSSRRSPSNALSNAPIAGAPRARPDRRSWDVENCGDLLGLVAEDVAEEGSRSRARIATVARCSARLLRLANRASARCRCSLASSASAAHIQQRSKTCPLEP